MAINQQKIEFTHYQKATNMIIVLQIINVQNQRNKLNNNNSNNIYFQNQLP